MVKVEENQTELVKVLEQMKEYLEGPKWWFCIKGDEKQQKNQFRGFYERTGINSLSHWPNLLPYYQNEPEKLTILNDLKEKLEKIKNNELPDYNQEIAQDICDYLLRQQEQAKPGQDEERLLRH